jgi:hypothetical protein
MIYSITTTLIWVPNDDADGWILWRNFLNGSYHHTIIPIITNGDYKKDIDNDNSKRGPGHCNGSSRVAVTIVASGRDGGVGRVTSNDDDEYHTAIEQHHRAASSDRLLFTGFFIPRETDTWAWLIDAIDNINPPPSPHQPITIDDHFTPDPHKYEFGSLTHGRYGMLSQQQSITIINNNKSIT